MPLDNEKLANGHEAIAKRIRSGADLHTPLPVQVNDSGQDFNSANGVSPNVSVVDSELTAVEQMIAMIGALLAEGERGAKSLEILISKIHPDLLADIVITNMRHLPKTSPPLTRNWKSPTSQQVGSQGSPPQVVAPSAPINSLQSSAVTAQAPFSSATAIATSLSQSDTSNPGNLTVDSRRDPRKVKFCCFSVQELLFAS